MEDERETEKPSLKDIFKDGLSKGFKRLPFKYKAIIIGILSGIFFFIIIITALISLIPFNFLSYSDSVTKNNDVQKEYEQYWDTLCNENNEGCSPEQVESAKELVKSQSAFYDKLTKLSNKYLSTDSRLKQQQKYTVLTTLFFGYDINDFTMGNGAFFIDDNDEITEEIKDGQTIYEKEADSIKELIKQFNGVSPYCKFQNRLENGELSAPIEEILKDSNGQPFSFNFFEKMRINMGSYTTNAEFNIAYENCLNRSATGSTPYIVFQNTKDSSESIENYYRYLSQSDYLDDKSVLYSYYFNYAHNNNLSENIDEWVEEDKIAVRMQIIEEIQMIVDEYMEENSIPMETISSSTSYWWPIGSVETTSQNGILFATGEPQYTRISSYFGRRNLTGSVEGHSGIDIPGTSNETNIIAALNGTVIKVNNSCANNGSLENRCGGSFGNYVQIMDIKGNLHIYGHMYPNSILVKEGDTVIRGQVIGKVGNSGRSTGSHLHFTIKANGVPDDPLNYVDPTNPRPSDGSTVNWNQSNYSEEEFITLLNNYYSDENSCNITAKERCLKFRDNIINDDGAKIIYNSALNKNINPEIYIARIYLEGYSPGSGFNYAGYGCTNTGGLSACKNFLTFNDAVDTFFNNISKYSSLEDMMSKYAYLGSYWYTGKHSGLGGCYYAEYIYPDGIPERVANACSKPDGYCSKDNTSNCEPTTEEDRNEYTNYQVRNMANVINKIFG